MILSPLVSWPFVEALWSHSHQTKDFCVGNCRGTRREVKHINTKKQPFNYKFSDKILKNFVTKNISDGFNDEKFFVTNNASQKFSNEN